MTLVQSELSKRAEATMDAILALRDEEHPDAFTVALGWVLAQHALEERKRAGEVVAKVHAIADGIVREHVAGLYGD